MKKVIHMIPAMMIIVLFAMSHHSVAIAEERENTIVNGVFIDKINISGMTREQAQEAVDTMVADLQDKGIAIIVEDEVVYTSMKELGYRYEPNHYVDQALGLATVGNLIKRYKDTKDIEQGTIVYPLTFTYDEDKLRRLVEEEATLYNIEPVNASFSRANNKFIYIDHKVGSKVDVDRTVEQIKNTLENWNRMDIVVDAVMVEDKPAYTKEMFESSNSLLGEFTTEFKDSVEGRAANLANGARLINNTVLLPGEEFSAYEYLLPFTESNGYYVANSYLNGKIVESVGGGACQVTTTLYNAVLFAELNIVERSAHSMTVSYVPLSMDAAVAEYSKNFRFSNNLDYPILIEALSKDRTITFRIWGHETRDISHRKLEFVSKTTKEIQPTAKDIITKDPTKPTTYRKVTQKARLGYKSELYKVVYVDGKEVERVLINKSSYAAEPNHVTIGTKKENVTATRE